jgi:hypothetical protein
MTTTTQLHGTLKQKNEELNKQIMKTGTSKVTQHGDEYTTDDPSKIGTGAIKYDGGKPCVYRGVIKYFPRALWGVAEISTFGAQKYAWDGWEDVEDGYNRYQDAKCRHQLLEAMGEELADDSKLAHLKHEAWGALAALELHLREKEKNV